MGDIKKDSIFDLSITKKQESHLQNGQIKMKTIQLIAAFVAEMKKVNLPANIKIGTFIVESNGHLINWAGTCGEYRGSTVTFQIEFLPQHIQHLIQAGVFFNFDNVKMAGISEKSYRFKAGRAAISQGKYAPYYYMGNPNNRQTGVVENWLSCTVTCDVYTLLVLDKYCRENHRDCVRIDNFHNLKASGWVEKEKHLQFPHCLLSNSIAKRIRKNVADKKKKIYNLLPVERRAIDQKRLEK